MAFNLRSAHAMCILTLTSWLYTLQIPLVLQLFDTLHSLCNLLVVNPDNLRQMCSGEQLASLDKNTLHSFVQLRADYRSSRLARHFSWRAKCKRRLYSSLCQCVATKNSTWPSPSYVEVALNSAAPLIWLWNNNSRAVFHLLLLLPLSEKKGFCLVAFCPQEVTNW